MIVTVLKCFLTVVCLVCRSPLQRSLQEIEKLAKEQAGCDFSLSSAQDVANVLFNVLKLPVPPNAKPLRGGKLYSTSAEVRFHLLWPWHCIISAVHYFLTGKTLDPRHGR